MGHRVVAQRRKRGARGDPGAQDAWGSHPTLRTSFVSFHHCSHPQLLVVTVSGAGDACRAVTVQGNKAITHVRPLQTCTLIVAQSRSVNTATAAPAIDRAAALVDGGTRDSTCLGRQGTFGSHIAGWWTRV